MKDKFCWRKWTTWITVVLLLLLAINYTFFRVSEVKYDVFISLLGLYFFQKYHTRINQDKVSYIAFCSLLVVHNAYLYPYSFFGLTFDVYMHFFSGIVVALIVDRWLALEKWGTTRRIATTLFLVLGIGALHEMVEWLGYAILGEGEGFLRFGTGDEGAWSDAMHDLFMNLFGAIATLVVKK